MTTRTLRLICLSMGLLLCFRLNWIVTLIASVIFIIIGFFYYHIVNNNKELIEDLKNFDEDLEELKDGAIDILILIVLFLLIIIMIIKLIGL